MPPISTSSVISVGAVHRKRTTKEVYEGERGGGLRERGRGMRERGRGLREARERGERERVGRE